MSKFCNGIDDAENVFIAPDSWKFSSTQVIWPPKSAKNVRKLIKGMVAPKNDWTISKCRWTNFEACKLMRLLK